MNKTYRATLLSVATALAAIAGVGVATPSSASNGQYRVTEKDGYYNTGVRVNAGQRVQISATSDQIWAGVWFSGWNGPAGWTSKCNNQCPLPGRRAYSLLAQIGNITYYVGSGTSIVPTESGEVILKINDDVPGNGSGYFGADVTNVG